MVTKTPVLFAANPKRGNNTKFDPLSNLTYAEQAGMKESTMSRVDVPIVMIDTLLSEEEEIRAMAALMNLNGDFDKDNPDGEILNLRFLQCFFSIAREYSEVNDP